MYAIRSYYENAFHISHADHVFDDPPAGPSEIVKPGEHSATAGIENFRIKDDLGKQSPFGEKLAGSRGSLRINFDNDFGRTFSRKRRDRIPASWFYRTEIPNPEIIEGGKKIVRPILL